MCTFIEMTVWVLGACICNVFLKKINFHRCMGGPLAPRCLRKSIILYAGIATACKLNSVFRIRTLKPTDCKNNFG